MHNITEYGEQGRREWRLNKCWKLHEQHETTEEQPPRKETERVSE